MVDRRQLVLDNEFFSTDMANQVFIDRFTTMATDAIQQVDEPALGGPYPVYQELGTLWADTREAMLALKGADAHKPEAGTHLANDLEYAVITMLQSLWEDHKVKAPLRMDMIVASYHLRHCEHVAKAGVETHALEEPSGGVPAVKPKGRFLDELVAKMNGQPAGTAAQRPAASGNDQGTVARASTVPAEIAQACERLVMPGPKPLRTGNDRMAFEVAEMCLLESDTFTQWVKDQKQTGHVNRESLTIARSVELAINEYGPDFLNSKCAEVMLRRLMACAVAGRAIAGGTKSEQAWKAASRLEELPGDGIGAYLKKERMAKMQAEMKTELQVEALLKGSMPKKD